MSKSKVLTNKSLNNVTLETQYQVPGGAGDLCSLRKCVEGQVTRFGGKPSTYFPMSICTLFSVSVSRS